MSNQRTIRRAQLERDIARAVDRLIAEFAGELQVTPHAVDVELTPTTSRSGEQRYVVANVRTHFESSDLD